MNLGSHNVQKHSPSGTWSLFSHGADIGVRGLGSTRNEAFENAALALTSAVTNPNKVRCKKKVKIIDQLASPEDPILLYDWLNAVIYSMATEKMLFGKYQLENKNGALIGWGWGENVDDAAHDPAVEVKGATMTCLSVKKNDNGMYIVECVVDV